MDLIPKSNIPCTNEYMPFCEALGETTMQPNKDIYRQCHLPGTFTNPNMLANNPLCKKFYLPCADECNGECPLYCD